MKELIVDQENKERIDKYIAKCVPDLSRMMIQKLIEENQILVNRNPVKTSYAIQKGDSITITIPEAKETTLKPQDIPLDIVYEDDDILVVNKAKGMVVHPAAGNPEGRRTKTRHCS